MKKPVKASAGNNVRDIKILNSCKGYEPTFIDNKKVVKSDLLATASGQLLPKINGGQKGPLHYTNLSVFLNTKRKMAFYSAYNIDGNTKDDVVRDLDFVPDPRILAEEQLGDPFYDLRKGVGKKNQDFDKGHMAANNEMAWNPAAQTKAYQTFFHTNACPQASILNKGIWKTLEAYFINESSDTANSKICVFSGPVLKDTDPAYVEDTSYKLPLYFFKVVVFKYGTKFYSTGFVMSQKLALEELGLIKLPPKKVGLKIVKEGAKPFEDFDYKDIFQVDVGLISAETGIKFAWQGVTPLSIPGSINRLNIIDKIKNSDDAKDKQKGLKAGAKGLTKVKSVTPKGLGFVFPK